jgi:hypothetical protein
MKPTTYIDWDNLVNIPFLFCQAVEDEKEQDFDIYYMGKLVLHDYNHCGTISTRPLCCSVESKTGLQTG